MIDIFRLRVRGFCGFGVCGFFVVFFVVVVLVVCVGVGFFFIWGFGCGLWGGFVCSGFF